MKVYKTKNTLFYSKPTMISRLMQLCDRYYEKNKHHPQRIYMTEKEWSNYEKELCKSPQLRQHFRTIGYPKFIPYSRSLKSSTINGIICMTFRGIPVVSIKKWKEFRKNKNK